MTINIDEYEITDSLIIINVNNSLVWTQLGPQHLKLGALSLCYRGTHFLCLNEVNETLKICVNFTIMLLGRRLRTSVVFKSNRGHFLSFRFRWICSKTSIGVTSSTKRVSRENTPAR